MKLKEGIFIGTKADKRCIEFDVAVSAEQSTEGGGGIGIKVLTFGKAGGRFSKQIKNSTVSRIVFDVYTPKPSVVKNETFNPIQVNKILS